MSYWKIMARARASVLVMLVSLIVPTTGWATVYYVDRNLNTDCAAGNYSVANHNCSGSDGNAYNTVQEGIDAASTAGDVISIRAGDYNGGVSMSHSGTTDNYITLQNYASESVSILPGSGATGINLNAKDWIKIKGLTIDGGKRGIAYLPGKTSKPSRHILIQECSIINQDTAGDGISGGIIGRIYYWTIDNCTLSGQTGGTGRQIMGWESEYGSINREIHVVVKNSHFITANVEDNMYFGGRYITIQNNIISGQSGVGHADAVQVDCTQDVLITGNIFYNAENFDMDYLTCPSGLHLDNTTITHNLFIGIGGIAVLHKEGRITVQYNTFYDSEITAVQSEERTGYGDGAYVSNNIFVANGGYNGYSDPRTIDNNLYYQNGTPTQNDDYGANSFSADPLFINPSDPDGVDNTWGTGDDGFRLQAASPACNAGDGESDIGAYSCQDGGDSVPPMAPTALRLLN